MPESLTSLRVPSFAWQAVGGTILTQTSGYYAPGYRLEPSGDVVRLRGYSTITGSISIGATLFTLATAWRPAATCKAFVRTGAGNLFLTINTNGTVTPDSGISGFLNLDGVTFYIG